MQHVACKKNTFGINSKHPVPVTFIKVHDVACLVTPALFTITSKRPMSVTALVIIESIALRSPQSASIALANPPNFAHSAATLLAATPLISATATSAPASARALAHAAPIPPPAPVTSVFRPLSTAILFLLLILNPVKWPFYRYIHNRIDWWSNFNSMSCIPEALALVAIPALYQTLTGVFSGFPAK